MVGTLDQQLAQISVAGLGDPQLGIALSGLTAFRSKSEIATHIATSLEALFVAQGEHEGQCGEVTYAINLDQSLRLRILGLCQLLDSTVVFFNLHRHVRDLLEQRTECL